jgi:hypothetical protein
MEYWINPQVRHRKKFSMSWRLSTRAQFGLSDRRKTMDRTRFAFTTFAAVAATLFAGRGGGTTHGGSNGGNGGAQTSHPSTGSDTVIVFNKGQAAEEPST